MRNATMLAASDVTRTADPETRSCWRELLWLALIVLAGFLTGLSPLFM